MQRPKIEQSGIPTHAPFETTSRIHKAKPERSAIDRSAICLIRRLGFGIQSIRGRFGPHVGTFHRYPVRGGLTLREGDYICECVHETGSLVAVDLVEVNPSLAEPESMGAQETVRAGCSLVRCALGESLL